MIDYTRGLAVINDWSNAQNADAANARAKFLSAFGKTQIETIGKASTGLDHGKIIQFLSADRYASVLGYPEPRDLYSALMFAGAPPSVLSTALGLAGDGLKSATDAGVGALKKSAGILNAASDGLTSVLKNLGIIVPAALLLVGAYFVLKSGVLKK